MPRANRHHLPGYIWHITHRCHQRQFLLRFARDRRAWIRWLFTARQRFGLCVLDYAVTCNHVHLLVRDRGHSEIARSLQLVAGRTGQAYNQRKRRRGAFWEDRYHATAVDTGDHLARCLVYIDLNMVRAGVVGHPAAWESGGYHEIQAPRRRYRIIDREALANTLGLRSVSELATAHAEWVDEAIRSAAQGRVPQWSEALAVGRSDFVARISAELGVVARNRRIEPFGPGHMLREASETYATRFRDEMGLLR
jgi:putative transposase